MANEPTFCHRCDHVDPQSRKKHPRYWLCLKSPNIAGQGFVHPELWTGDPFKRCKEINGGACALFEEIREAEPGQVDDYIPH